MRMNRNMVIYGDIPSRKRVREAFTRRGHQVILVDVSEPMPAVAETACVLLSVKDIRGARQIGVLRHHFRSCPILAIVPGGCPHVLREAYHAGTWDCLDDAVGATEVVMRAEQAVRTYADNAQRAAGANSLPKHGVFLASLVDARAHCQATQAGLSLVLMDLDRFAECNTRYSPSEADGVLKWFGTVVKSVARPIDLLGHFEGDCLVIAMPQLSAAGAAEFVRTCREAMCASPPIIAGRPHPITASAGVAQCAAGFPETEYQLIQRGRLALEQAKRDGENRTTTWTELLDRHVNQPSFRGLSLDGASRMVERLRQHVASTHSESTQALVAAVEARDPYTRAHSLTVAAYAEAIARRMRLSPRMIATVRSAALLHDVGKIGIPDRILTKPGSLTEDEFDIIRQHPQKALDILDHVSFLADEKPIILHHHERFDGAGYPAGLAGDEIPIGARIVAVADALDTMLSPRTYKKAYSRERVRAELAENAGKQFDPTVIEATLSWLDGEPAFATSETPPPVADER